MHKSSSWRVGALQATLAEGGERNRDTLSTGISDAAEQNIELLVLPELHNTPYFCQRQDTARFDLAEPLRGPTCEQLGALAREHNMVIVGSIFERRAAGLYHNTALVLDRNGELAGFYRKMHIPDDPGFNEKFYFTPGDTGFQPIDCALGRLGVLVCWDQWYPEAARLMALRGAEVLIYPTAIGWDRSDEPAEQQRQLDAWQLAQRGHAVSNGLPVIACNRVGYEQGPEEGGIDFWGASFIAGAQGEMLAEASRNEAQLLSAEINPQHSDDVRRIWPFLRDRRIDAYDKLTSRFDD